MQKGSMISGRRGRRGPEVLHLPFSFVTHWLLDLGRILTFVYRVVYLQTGAMLPPPSKEILMIREIMKCLVNRHMKHTCLRVRLRVCADKHGPSHLAPLPSPSSPFLHSRLLKACALDAQVSEG